MKPQNDYLPNDYLMEAVNSLKSGDGPKEYLAALNRAKESYADMLQVRAEQIATQNRNVIAGMTNIIAAPRLGFDGNYYYEPSDYTGSNNVTIGYGTGYEQQNNFAVTGMTYTTQSISNLAQTQHDNHITLNSPSKTKKVDHNIQDVVHHEEIKKKGLFGIFKKHK